jgi:CBS domain-containing protein
MNTIAENIANFLKEYAPFNHLSHDELVEVSNSIGVIMLEKNKTLFKIEDKLHDSFYVLASGVIHLSFIADAEETMLNKCYAGDVFGLRPFFAKNNYMMTAKAREDSVVYAIPIKIFKPFVSQNPNVLDFLLESFASNTRNSFDKEKSGNLITDTIYTDQTSGEIQYFQSLSYNKTPLKMAANAVVKEVAQLMTDNLSNSVIIIEENNPIGIVTDTDFRSKIANGRFPLTSTVDKIMSSPVVTVSENVSVAEAQLMLLKHSVSHLCVTIDGSDKSDVKGVISEHDLVVAQSNNPGVLVKEIKRALTPKELKQVREKLTDLIQSSIAKNIPLPHIYNISGEIISAINRRAIELAILDLGSPPARFAWLSIGSQGRKEQLLLTDQDSILIFEDVAAEKYRDVKDYFVKLSKRVTSILEKVGFSYCPNGHMASNMAWCKSLTDWIKQYNNWMKTPGEISDGMSSIFFDYEIVFGENKLEDAITEVIFSNVKSNNLFFDYLGNDTLRKHPPLNFFKKFNLEEEGENKGKFDIKNKAIMPLIDGARLFILSMQIKGINNTYLRFKQLAMADPKYSELYLSCAEAFLVLSKYRTLEGLKNDSSGQFINIEELTKNDREKIKSALVPMKDLEELIKDRFQLTQFS